MSLYEESDLLMKLTVDRIEGNIAVCENPDGELAGIPLAMLPGGTAEGTVLTIAIDKEEMRLRGERIKSLMDDIWKG